MSKSLARFLILATLLTVIVPLQVRHAHGYSFQTPVLLENMSSVDSLPAALQSSDGTIWVAWESYNPRTDLFYMRIRTDGSIVTPIQNLTGPATAFNRAPTLTQLQNGTVFFAWAANITGHFKLWAKTYTGGLWTRPFQLTSGSDDDQVPKSTVAQNGTLWLVWERDNSGGSRQVYYKTLNGNAWSGDIQLTIDATLNTLPNVMSVKGGSIWVSWSKFISSGSFYNIYYQTFNGTAWSNQLVLTNVNLSTFGDTHPDLVQDRNGTIWAFWSREEKLSTTIFQDKLWYKFSGNGGQTWSSDTKLTFGGDANVTIDDLEPSAIQGVDKSLWIFYSSDLTNAGSLFDIYYIKTNQIYPVHDPAVTKVTVSPAKMYPWNVATINVTLADLGDFIENIQLTVQAVNKTSFNVGSASTFLASGQSKIFSFTWNASSAPSARYTIIASILLGPGETMGAGLDNTFRYRSLAVLLRGDLNKDYTINIIDAAIMAVAYGSRPGNSSWNPNADLNRDGIVNIIDFAMLGANYGKSI